MKLVDCTLAQHGAAIVGNLNEVIENSTVVYDYVPRSPATMEPWFATKTASRFPVIGAEDGDGDLLGFATYATFRAWRLLGRFVAGRRGGRLMVLTNPRASQTACVRAKVTEFSTVYLYAIQQNKAMCS
jgi:hypothetical protein